VLEISRDASQEGIKKAYRKQALRWHPDKHRGVDLADANERFRQIAEAYQALSDPETRATYDRWNGAGREGLGQPVYTRVLHSRTFGMFGVNLTVYWTAQPTHESEADSAPEEECEGPQVNKSRDAFQLFRDVFGFDSPAAILERLRAWHASHGFPFSGTTSTQAPGTSNVSSACTGSMYSEERETFLRAELQAGDLTEDEFKELTQSQAQRASELSKDPCPCLAGDVDPRESLIRAEFEAGDLTEDEYQRLLHGLGPLESNHSRI